MGHQVPVGPLTGRRLAEIGTNQHSPPRRSACCDCPSSSAIDAAAHETKPTELPRVPVEPVGTVGGPPGPRGASHGPPPGQKSAPISQTPHRSACCDCPSSSAIDAAQKKKPKKMPVHVTERAAHPLVGPGAASEVQGRRRSLRRCWPAHARAREVGPWRPRVVAIRDRAARGKAH